MPIYIPILVLIVVPVVMLAIRLVRPGFVYHWLIAVIGALAAWPLTILIGRNIPESVNMINWQSGTLFPAGIGLVIDPISWPFAVSLVTLVLAVILTDAARATEADWLNWAGSLLLTSLGFLVVLAANPLTLLLTWTALDLVEMGVLLNQVSASRVRRQVIMVIATRMLGSGVLIARGNCRPNAGPGPFLCRHATVITLFVITGSRSTPGGIAIASAFLG